jgi:hypothetical protein
MWMAWWDSASTECTLVLPREVGGTKVKRKLGVRKGLWVWARELYRRVPRSGMK